MNTYYGLIGNGIVLNEKFCHHLKAVHTKDENYNYKALLNVLIFWE